jgi:glycosyltransferase involved in cell wall biosynthesis
VEADSPGREAVAMAMLTQRSGWRAIIASSGGKLVNEAERAAVRHVRIPFTKNNILSRWRNYVLLKALALRERPALIHAHGLTAARYAQPLAREMRLPIVIDIAQHFYSTPQARKMFEALKHMMGLVRTPSQFMAQFLQKDFGLDDDHLHLVPPGVDLQLYSAGSISAERLQKLSQLWRMPEQASVILVPIPFKPGMGHKVFLNALAKLKNENIFAVLVGRDDPASGIRAEIESLVTQLGLDGKVIMPDYCHDLPAACWLSSVVVSPNINPLGHHTELLAAQAIGRPVIVTDTGANRELVLKDETAWIIAPENVDALTEALSQAVHLNTNQRLNLADSAHNFIADNFPQDIMFDGIMQMYEKLLQPSARRTQVKAA